MLVVCNDNTFGNFDIFLSKSTDGGQTFSTPQNISNNLGFSNETINVIDILFESSIIVIDNYVYVFM